MLMKVETFPEKMMQIVNNPSTNQPGKFWKIDSLEQAETFEDIRKEFDRFTQEYFKEYVNITSSESKLKLKDKLAKIGEMEKLRGQVFAMLVKRLKISPEARRHQDMLKRSGSAEYRAEYKKIEEVEIPKHIRIDEVNIPDANAIKAEADIFDAVCAYFELTANRLRMIRDNYEKFLSQSSSRSLAKKAPNNTNIKTIVQEQIISQAIIRNPGTAKDLFYSYLEKAKDAYDLSDKERGDFEKGILGLVGGYLYYSREGRAVFPTAKSDATYKTDLYLVRDGISDADKNIFNEAEYNAEVINNLKLEKRDLVEIIQTKCTAFPLDTSIEIRYDRKSGFEVRRFTNGNSKVIERTRSIKDALFYLENKDFQQEAEEYFVHYCIGHQMGGRFTVFRLEDAREIHAEAGK
jgi:hypothetical protein